MNVLTIMGTAHKGNTRAVVDLFLNEFEDNKNEFEEIILPNDSQNFCHGCANCILKGEDKCPH
jgi:multimeric flavodoxin WrbA